MTLCLDEVTTGRLKVTCLSIAAAASGVALSMFPLLLVWRFSFGGRGFSARDCSFFFLDAFFADLAIICAAHVGMRGRPINTYVYTCAVPYRCP